MPQRVPGLPTAPYPAVPYHQQFPIACAIDYATSSRHDDAAGRAADPVSLSLWLLACRPSP